MARAKPIRDLDCQAPTGENARVIARVRLDELYDWENYAGNPYATRELHNLRIAAKRLRYTLEVFEAALPASCKLIVHELEQIQEELGALHDCDVMIALLRLCLGSQDSGPAYVRALAAVQQRSKGKTLLPPELVAELLAAAVTPTAEERYGLELLVLKQHQAREECYATFRQHWYQLQARDFRREILHSLDS